MLSLAFWSATMAAVRKGAGNRQFTDIQAMQPPTLNMLTSDTMAAAAMQSAPAMQRQGDPDRKRAEDNQQQCPIEARTS